jgi:hypothetical protein
MREKTCIPLKINDVLQAMHDSGVYIKYRQGLLMIRRGKTVLLPGFEMYYDPGK